MNVAFVIPRYGDIPGGEKIKVKRRRIRAASYEVLRFKINSEKQLKKK